MTEKRLELVRGSGARGASAAIVVGTMIGTGIFLKARGKWRAEGAQRLRRIRGVDRGRDSFDFWRVFRSRNWDR